MTSTETFDRQVQSQPVESGFRPQLFTVVGGSYASNAVYGSGATALNNYDTVTLRGDSNGQLQTKASIRQSGSLVNFEIVISLDLTQADPQFPSSEELRIRTVPLTLGEPNRYLNTLPPPDDNFNQPSFDDVEILLVDSTGATVGAVPAALTSMLTLSARFLYGGELALLGTVADAPNYFTNALTANALAGNFGAVAEPTRLRISVRGSYKSKSARI
jgi:hypothetical protein